MRQEVWQPSKTKQRCVCGEGPCVPRGLAALVGQEVWQPSKSKRCVGRPLWALWSKRSS